MGKVNKKKLTGKEILVTGSEKEKNIFYVLTLVIIFPVADQRKKPLCHSYYSQC